MSDSLPKLVPGGLKPLQVTRNRRSKSNGGPANVELATDSEVERRKSADSRTHSRRESGAVDGVNVVQTTGARVSPSSPVHRAGYHDAIDDEPSNVGIESSMSAAVSPRHVVSPHSGSGHQHTDRPRPGLLARLNFFRAPAQIEPFSPGTTSKPTAGSVWPSAIHTDFKLVPAKDDGKESKPTSPAMLMLQQKQRCCGFHSGRRMFGMLIAVFAIALIATLIAVPVTIVMKAQQGGREPVEVKVLGGSTGTTSTESPHFAQRVATKSKDAVIIAKTTKKVVSKTTSRGLPPHNSPLPPITPLPPADVVTSCVQPGTIALTFDDGPYDHTGTVLDVLSSYGVPATFFVCGRNFGDIRWPKYAAMVDRMTGEGHVVGSHTWGHRTLRGLGEGEVEEQLGRLENATYYQFGFRMRYLRPPSGRYDDLGRRVAGEQGYTHLVLWTIDPEDWASPTDPSATFSRFSSALAQHDVTKDGVIVLLHDVHEVTAKEVVRRVVEHAKEVGWRFVTMDECLGEWGKAYKEVPVNNWYAYDK